MIAGIAAMCARSLLEIMYRWAPIRPAPTPHALSIGLRSPDLSPTTLLVGTIAYFITLALLEVYLVSRIFGGPKDGT